jgi:hypothetical protein
MVMSKVNPLERPITDSADNVVKKTNTSKPQSSTSKISKPGARPPPKGGNLTKRTGKKRPNTIPDSSDPSTNPTKPSSSPPNAGEIQTPRTLININNETRDTLKDTIRENVREKFAPWSSDIHNHLKFCDAKTTLPFDPYLIPLGTNWHKKSMLGPVAWKKLEGGADGIIKSIPGPGDEGSLQKEKKLIQRLGETFGVGTTAINGLQVVDADAGTLDMSSPYSSLNAIANGYYREAAITNDEKRLLLFLFYSTLIVMKSLYPGEVGHLLIFWMLRTKVYQFDEANVRKDFPKYDPGMLNACHSLHCVFPRLSEAWKGQHLLLATYMCRPHSRQITGADLNSE